MRYSLRFAVAFAALSFAFASVAMAQDAQTIRNIFESAPKTPTSVGNVRIFAGPPAGFNALTATGEELAEYGLPQRPDKATQPEQFAAWTRAMSALKYQATDVKALATHNEPNRPLNKPSAGAAVSNVPTTTSSGNWSGVANTNKLTKWNKLTSFDYIASSFVVPSAQPPFNACANGITGPFLVSIWNGIDGFDNGDVVQGGTQGYSNCTPADTSYIAWVEWYPSYPELEIVCGSSACPVVPGDTMFVVTYGTAGTAEQTVFVENVSREWYGTFGLPYVTGPGVVGSSEEQIVERPCCNGSDLYALNNYDYGYFAGAYGYDVHGTLFYAGEQTATTYLLDMYDDAGTEIISEVIEQGSLGNAGKYMLWFSDAECAYSGGCTP